VPRLAVPSLEPVAGADRLTRTLHVDRATLGAAVVLLAGDPTPPPAAAIAHLSALAAAGAVVEGRLEPWVAEIVATMTAAPLEVVVEVFSGGAMVASTVWSDGPWGALATTHDDDTVTVRSVPGSLLAATLADLVGLDPTADPADHGSLRRLPAAALHRFHARLVAGDGPGAAAALADDPGVTTEELELMLDLVTGLGRSWRITSGPRSMVVVDGGRRGLWQAIGPSPAVEGTPPVDDIALLPTTPSALWHRLLDLFPLPGASPLSALDPEGLPCPPPAPSPNASSSSPPPPASAA